MLLTLNFSPNEDIEFIGAAIHNGCALAYGAGGPKRNDQAGFLFATTRRAHAGTVPVEGSVMRAFRSAPSTSLVQLTNLLKLARLLFALRGVRVLTLVSPSALNIPVIVWALASQARLVVAVHDVDPHYRGLRGCLYALQNRMKLRFAHQVLVFSDFSKGRIDSGRTRGRVHVVPLPTPAEFLVSTRSASRPATPRWTFVWFGRAEIYKGAQYLPAFAEQILPMGLTLLVVSPIPPSDPLFSSLDLLPNVTLVPEFVDLDELLELLSQCEVNLCPYVAATQSGVVAMCKLLGVPSIVHDVGALPAQVAPDAGVVARPNILEADVAALLEAARHCDSAAMAADYRRNDSYAALTRVVGKQLVSAFDPQHCD